MLHLISDISTGKPADHSQESTPTSKQECTLKSASDCSEKCGHRDHGFPSSLHQFCKHLLCFGCCNDLKGPPSWEDALLNKGDTAEYSADGFDSETVYLA